jgi:hypothetical protein
MTYVVFFIIATQFLEEDEIARRETRNLTRVRCLLNLNPSSAIRMVNLIQRLREK